MKTYKIYQVDSFTRDRFHGNPAGVVPDAKGLTDEQMLSIARELNNSETAFIFEADSPDYDIEVRFFYTHNRSSHMRPCHNSRPLCPGQRNTYGRRNGCSKNKSRNTASGCCPHPK